MCGFRVSSIRPATNMKAEVKTSKREAREKETIKARFLLEISQ